MRQHWHAVKYAVQSAKRLSRIAAHPAVHHAISHVANYSSTRHTRRIIERLRLGLSSPPVLIWLNGPFGVGKTATAEALVKRRRPRCVLFDPEPLGSMLRQVASAIDPVEDFQDLYAWRLLVPETVRVLRAAYASTIVMPMTVWRRDYFNELAAALRRVDTDVRCFRLMAAEDVLRARIMGRPATDGNHDWCLDHLYRVGAHARPGVRRGSRYRYA